MKKNYLFGLTAMAAMMMFTSCSEEELVKQPQVGELAQVSINVTTPELGAATRAFGDGTTAKRLHYAVYNVKGEGENRTRTYLEELTVDGTQEINLKTTVDLQLVTGNTYDVIFWADADEQDQLYTLDWTTVDNPTVTINYENITCNNEGYDAFYGKITFKVEGAQTETVKLKRPFAQLNIGTNDIDEATNAGYQLAKTEVEVETYETLHLWEKGKDINVAEAVSGKRTVTFASSAIPSNEYFPVSGYEYMAMNYLLRPADKELTDVMFRFYSTEDELKERTYASVPLQRNWRTNIYGQLITSDVDVNVEIVPGFGENNQNNHQLEHLSIAKAEDLAAALTANKENIAVALTSDIELPVSSLGQMTGGSGEYKLGAENTKNISIDLNGHKLTFTTTYWSVIGAKNADATITIKNGTVTSSQATGTWNSYDMAFANCNYIIERVIFEKAVAFENEGKAVSLKNVTINEGHDYYAMWITAEGQTVNIDGLEINSAGRGIKIDEQYVDAPAKVTLNIANAKFTTAKKAAIVVKSEAGADINLSNVNIAGVKADGINAVWVDEDSKNHADKVTVNGGFKIVEGAAATNPFTIPGNTVEVAAGTYKFPAEVASGVTINCAEGTVFEGASKLNINGATVVGATFSNPVGDAVGGTIDGTFEDCTFTGSNALRWCNAGETVVFKKCVFDGDVYGVHFDGGDNKEVLFQNCTFSGFNAFAAAIKLVTFDGCTFRANGKSGYNGANLWGSAKMINTNFEFDGSVQNEWIDAIGADKTYEFTDCTINGASMLNGDYFFSRNVGTKAKVDGVEYTRAEGGYWVGDNGATTVATAEALQDALANTDVKDIYLAAGTTFEGTFAINSNKNFFSDANNQATIKGRVEIRSVNPTFKYVTFDRNDTDSNNAMQTSSNALQYKAVVMIYGDQTNTIKFEECKFLNNKGTHKSAITNVACELIVDKCYFEGYSSGIYSQANLSITNSTFNYTGGNNVIASINGCGDNGGKFIFKGNTITNKIFTLSQFLGTVGFGNGTYHFDVQDNTGAGFDHYFLNVNRVANKTFADGSEKF